LRLAPVSTIHGHRRHGLTRKEQNSFSGWVLLEKNLGSPFLMPLKVAGEKQIEMVIQGIGNDALKLRTKEQGHFRLHSSRYASKIITEGS